MWNGREGLWMRSALLSKAELVCYWKKSLKERALSAFWRMLWCCSCCGNCPVGHWSISGAVLALALPLKAGNQTYEWKTWTRGISFRAVLLVQLESRLWLLLGGCARLAVGCALRNVYYCFNYAFCSILL